MLGKVLGPAATRQEIANVVSLACGGSVAPLGLVLFERGKFQVTMRQAKDALTLLHGGLRLLRGLPVSLEAWTPNAEQQLLKMDASGPFYWVKLPGFPLQCFDQLPLIARGLREFVTVKTTWEQALNGAVVTVGVTIRDSEQLQPSLMLAWATAAGGEVERLQQVTYADFYDKCDNCGSSQHCHRLCPYI